MHSNQLSIPHSILIFFQIATNVAFSHLLQHVVVVQLPLPLMRAPPGGADHLHLVREVDVPDVHVGAAAAAG